VLEVGPVLARLQSDELSVIGVDAQLLAAQNVQRLLWHHNSKLRQCALSLLPCTTFDGLPVVRVRPVALAAQNVHRLLRIGRSFG